MKKRDLPFDVSDLEFAPSQVWGSVRLVPLIRKSPIENIRLSARSYNARLTAVGSQKGTYLSYIPHGLVVDWNHGSPIASYGTHLSEKKKAQDLHDTTFIINSKNRLVQKESKNRLRILPLHMTLDALLLLFAKQPSIAWEEFADQYVGGQNPWVCTSSLSGWGFPYLYGALEHFEIHRNQTGVLIFIGDAFASAFVVSHPEDYRTLHRTIIEDVYCKTLRHYGYNHVPCFSFSLKGEEIHSLEQLEKAVHKEYVRWQEFRADMAYALFDRPLFVEDCYKKKEFTLQRFITSPQDDEINPYKALSNLHPSDEYHIGECIRRKDGKIAYLKTYRLNRKQCTRIKIISLLESTQWNLEAAAQSRNISKERLQYQMRMVDLGYLLKKH